MGDRSISVGGNATGSTLVSGDRNSVQTAFTVSSLPPPESVDIRAELTALRAVLPPRPSRWMFLLVKRQFAEPNQTEPKVLYFSQSTMGS